MSDAELNVKITADFASLQNAAGAVRGTIADLAGSLGGVRTAAQSIGQASAASLPAMAQALAAARAAAEAQTQEIKLEISALQASLRQKEAVWSAEASRHQITQDQKYAAFEAETEAEYRAQLALLQKEASIDGLTLSRKQALVGQIETLQQKHTLAMIKLDEQSISASQSLWQGYFATLEGAFDSQLSGLIKGTTTWGTAFRNVLADLLVKFIEAAEKMTVQWAASEIAQTSATTSGAAARAAASAGATAAASAGSVAAVLHSIMASAAETFAGIFGFLSPVMGPAAAGPAAAGQATVAAAAGSVGAFAQGSWALPADMLAQVHKGEMIVPAAQTPWAQSLMAGAAGASSAPGAGGDVHVHHATHFNVTSLDSRDVKRWFAGNGRTILDTINASVRSGAHLGLSKLGG